jgi:magnesium transporter
MDPSDAAEARSLVRHDPNTAGGLMVTEFVTFRDDVTVHDVFTCLRERRAEFAEYDIQYLYVVDSEGRPVGVLRARDLLLAPASQRIAEIMIREVRVLPSDLSLQEVASIFEEHGYIGLPVVDRRGLLIGVVRSAAVDDAMMQQSDAAFLAAKGIIGGEEFRTHPLGLRVHRRATWLFINVLLNLASASVIAFNQDVLEQVVALAIFLPIISDMSGSAGQQAVAVSIRELSVGLVRDSEIMRVAWKEIGVGVINGLLFSLILGLVAWGWDGSAGLGLVVGGAMGINILVGGTVGGILPLIVKRCGFDPALVSGLLLTTITDVVGFFTALFFAAQMLAAL